MIHGSKLTRQMGQCPGLYNTSRLLSHPSSDLVANTHLSPRVGQHRDIVERATHVANTHVRIDVDDVAATGIATRAMVRSLISSVPCPVACEELGRDVPSPHFCASPEVTSDASHPGP